MRRFLYITFVFAAILLASCGDRQPVKRSKPTEYKAKGDLDTARKLYEDGKFAESEA